MARKARDEKLSADKARKKQQQDSATSQRICDTASRVSRMTSQRAAGNIARRRPVVGHGSGVATATPQSIRTCNVQSAQRYSK